jgi:hypothetical protein
MVTILRTRLTELDHLVARSEPDNPPTELSYPERARRYDEDQSVRGFFGSNWERSVARGKPKEPDPVVQELQLRFAKDQAVRSIFSQLKWTEGLSPAAANNWLLVAGTRMAAIDCDNTAWLKEQLAKIGWFTIPKFGGKADMAALHLVQHADRDPAFQREMLDKLQALPRGQTDGRRLGTLFDRVAHAEGRLLKYGTQGECKDGQWVPFESEDPGNLDARRASLGMAPMAEYVEIVSREACPH